MLDELLINHEKWNTHLRRCNLIGKACYILLCASLLDNIKSWPLLVLRVEDDTLSALSLSKFESSTYCRDE